MPLIMGIAAVLISMNAAAAAPDQSFASLLGEFRATRTGVDAAGKFWAWDAEARSVTSHAHNGSRRVVALPVAASAVDADESRGILALTDSGGVVRAYDWKRQPGRQITLTNPASNVCWLSGDEFAVAPLFASHLLEVWNLRTGNMVRTLVPVPVILRPARGAVLARTTLIRYDAGHREIVAVDAIAGVVRVVRPDGRVARTANLPEAVAFRAWLQQVDADARSRGESQTPSLWHYTAVTIASDGALWVGEEYDEKSVRAFRVTRAGKVERRTLTTTCPSLRFEAWQGHFVFYHDPRSPRPPCVGVRRQ